MKNSDCSDKRGQLVHLFSPTSFGARLFPVSYQKEAAFQELYLGKCPYSILASIYCGCEWLLSPPPPFAVSSSPARGCARSAVLIASLVLEGRQQEGTARDSSAP